MGRLTLLGIAIAGLVLAGLATLEGRVLALALPLVLYLGAALWARPGPPELEVERAQSADRVHPDRPIDIRLTVRNAGPALAEVHLWDQVPQRLTLTEGHADVLTTLDADGQVELSYRLQGDRVGLIAFAGTAVIKCPLTLDYGFFRMMLKNIAPESVSRGGTMIGDALRTALDQVFDDAENQYKDIILITDGEDHDSFPKEAAAEAGERGIRLIAIGIGDENEGRRIPVTDESGNRTFLKYKGQEVWTRLDADTLRQMVNATPGGRYLNVATGTIDLGDVYMKLVASAEKKALQSETVKRYEEKFQIFLAVMMGLLVLEMLISERKK